MSRRPVVAALAAALAALLAPTSPALAGPSSPTTASVSLGDSYISGEAGRWNGNSNAQLGSRSGTDRAYANGFYDAGRVYLGGSAANGCHRSDVAEIRGATVAVAEEVNLACSGATASNVFRAASGGTSRYGEPPQADQLLPVAQSRNVKLIVLSIGGNDLGFAGIIAACATDWTTSPSWWPRYCYRDQQAVVDRRMPGAMAGVAKAIDEIRAVMATAGYAASQYRLVLQGYPSPVSRGSENRYSQSGWTRLTTGGCPFWNRDLDWARDSLVAQIASNLRSVAAAKGAQFLDLRDMLQGREVCAKGTSLATSSNPPSPTRSEWTRFLVSGIGQGDLQESFHPNAYGQRALGRCLTLVAAQPGAAYACRNVAGAGPETMTLAAVAGASAARAPRLGRVRTVERRWPARFPSRAKHRLKRR